MNGLEERQKSVTGQPLDEHRRLEHAVEAKAEEAADMWRKEFADAAIMQSTALNQYEFLLCRKYQPTVKMLLTK